MLGAPLIIFNLFIRENLIAKIIKITRAATAIRMPNLKSRLKSNFLVTAEEIFSSEKNV